MLIPFGRRLSAVSFIQVHTGIVQRLSLEPLFKLLYTLKPIILTKYLLNECLRIPNADFAKILSIRIPLWKPKICQVRKHLIIRDSLEQTVLVFLPIS